MARRASKTERRVALIDEIQKLMLKTEMLQPKYSGSSRHSEGVIQHSVFTGLETNLPKRLPKILGIDKA